MKDCQFRGKKAPNDNFKWRGRARDSWTINLLEEGLQLWAWPNACWPCRTNDRSTLRLEHAFLITAFLGDKNWHKCFWKDFAIFHLKGTMDGWHACQNEGKSTTSCRKVRRPRRKPNQKPIPTRSHSLPTSPQPLQQKAFLTLCVITKTKSLLTAPTKKHRSQTVAGICNGTKWSGLSW